MSQDFPERTGGGPAFPLCRPNQYSPQGEVIQRGFTEGGMSLRDWFAGLAMQGMLADSRFEGLLDKTSEIAYDFADAMLKERDKK